MYLEKFVLDIEEGIIQLPKLFDVENRKLYFFIKEEGCLTLYYSERIDDNMADEQMIAVHSIPVRADGQRRISLPQQLLELTGAEQVTIIGKIVGFELNFHCQKEVSLEDLDRVHRELKLI